MGYLFLIVLGALLGLLTGWWIWVGNRQSSQASLAARLELSEEDTRKLRVQNRELKEKLHEIIATRTKLIEEISRLQVQLETNPAEPLQTAAGQVIQAAATEQAEAVAKHDLKQIRGIGPALEKQLNDLAVFNFYQIAAWDEQAIAEISKTSITSVAGSKEMIG